MLFFPSYKKGIVNRDMIKKSVKIVRKSEVIIWQKEYYKRVQDFKLLEW